MSKKSSITPIIPPGKKKIFVGTCIYCGSKNDLRNEHAIPESLNGDLILESASCRKCEVITGKFEARYTRETLKPFRDFWGYKSKRTHKNRLTTFPMKAFRKGKIVNTSVSKEDYIPLIPLLELGHPEMYANIPHPQGLKYRDAKLTVFYTRSNEEVIGIGKKMEADHLRVEFTLDINDFLRMIAKIAYCFAVVKYGLNSIAENYILNGILGKSHDLYRWVGSEGKQLLFNDGKQIDAQHLVGAGLTSDGTIQVKIKLFKNMETPEYIVLVGKVSDTYLAIMKCAGYDVLA